VKFELDGKSLRATMIRLDQSAAPAHQWQQRDQFTISRP